MRFLIDNALSPDLALALSAAGYDAIHVRDLGMAADDDEVIFDRAAQDDRTIISADTDFGALLAMRQEVKPSVLLLRGATPRRPSDQAALLLANLPQLANDLTAGSIVIIQPARIRIRRLPMI